MGVMIFFLTMLLLVLQYDLLLRLSFLLVPSRIQAMVNRLQYEGCRRLILMARVYAGLKVRLDNPLQEAPPGSVLILANHQSLVDIPMLVYAFPRHPLRFVAKRELGRGLPGFSPVLRMGRHALIDRKGGMRGNERKLACLARESVRYGYSPVVFPEGTRSRTGAIQAFHSAGVRMIERHMSLPVVTVALHGGYRIARLWGLIRHLRDSVYRIRVLSRYPAPRDRKETLALLERAREEITNQVNQWKKQET